MALGGLLVVCEWVAGLLWVAGWMALGGGLASWLAGCGWWPAGWAGLSWAGLRWAGLGWPGACWPGLGWAGLGWPGLGWAGARWLARFLASCGYGFARWQNLPGPPGGKWPPESTVRADLHAGRTFLSRLPGHGRQRALLV